MVTTTALTILLIRGLPAEINVGRGGLRHSRKSIEQPDTFGRSLVLENIGRDDRISTSPDSTLNKITIDIPIRNVSTRHDGGEQALIRGSR